MVSFIQTVDVTILLHQVTSISYKKLVPGLDLQVSMKGGMAGLSKFRQTRWTAHNIQLVFRGFLNMMTLALGQVKGCTS